jgi:hypothetical protein
MVDKLEELTLPSRLRFATEGLSLAELLVSNAEATPQWKPRRILEGGLAEKGKEEKSPSEDNAAAGT